MANLDLFTTTSEADARFVSKNKEVSKEGFSLRRMWPLIDATVSDTLGITLDAVATYTNPKADNETYTGTFVNSSVDLEEPGKEYSERYVNIIQLLTLVQTPTNIGTLAALEPIIIQGNKITTAHAWEQGEEEMITYVYKNLNPSARNTMMALSDSSLVSGLPDVDAPAYTWTYIDRDFKEEENGTATFSVLFQQVVFSNTSGDTPDRVLANTRTLGYDNYDPQNDKSGIDKKKIDGGDNIPISALEEIRDNQVADNGFAITGIRISDNKDGSGSLRRTQIKKRSTTDQFESQWLANNGTQPEAEIIEWKDLSATDATTVYTNAKTNTNDMTNATPASPSNHLLKSVRRIPTQGVDSSGDQLFDVVRVSFIPQTSGSVWWDGNNFDYILYNKKNIGTATTPVQIVVEHYRTSSEGGAYSFSRGNTVAGHSIDDNAPTAWTGTPKATVIGGDATHHTGVKRLGHEKFFAVRVLMWTLQVWTTYEQ